LEVKIERGLKDTQYSKLWDPGEALGWINNALLKLWFKVVNPEVVDIDMVNPKVANLVVVYLAVIFVG